MNATLTNPIIFTTVQFTILIMAENVPEVVVPSPPARNPFEQALVWIGFGTEVTVTTFAMKAECRHSKTSLASP